MNNKGLTSAALKNIAIITMFIDHLTCVLFRPVLLPFLGKEYCMWVYYPLRAVGRIAFMIFAYQVGQAIVYTRSRKRYLAYLGTFAIVSELPFDLALKGKFYDPAYQNVFVTLFIGALCLCLIEHYKDHKWTLPVITGVGFLLAELVKSDYGGPGVLLIVLLYVYRNNYYAMAGIAYPAFLISLGLSNAVVKILEDMNGNIVDKFINAGMGAAFEGFCIVGLKLIKYYNGQKGKGLNKWFYYLFYPGHLLILYGFLEVLNHI